MRALKETNYHLPGQINFYRGKVRDVYTAGSFLIMIATDRISAFDVVLPKAIPYKGQVLNQIASRMLKSTSDIVPNWLIDTPDPNVTIGKICEPYKVEMVVRNYLTGHAWREYNSGRKTVCGVKLPDGLKENDQLPNPILTPTTKADEGHDLDISREEILNKKIIGETEYILLEKYALQLFIRGTELAKKQGLILVDTKYEFGKSDNTITLIDEIHTPDSSRYFYEEGYEENQRAGKPQRQLSKEFVRQWLIENNFQGKTGQNVPEMTDSWIEQISLRYIELYEKIMGERFVKANNENIHFRIEKNILAALNSLNAELKLKA
jgi:phosphoribosylaminoimidazole-succinocarboxamide synthase